MESVEVEVDQGDAALGAGRPQQAGQLTDGGGLVGQPGEGIDEGDALQLLLDLVLLADVLDGADGDELRTVIIQGGAPPLQHHLQQAIAKEQAMFDPAGPACAERLLEGGIDQGAVLGMHRLEKVGVGGGRQLRGGVEDAVGLVRPEQLPRAVVQLPAAHMGDPLGLLEKGPQPAAEVEHQVVGQLHVRLNRRRIEGEEVLAGVAEPLMGRSIAVDEMTTGQIKDHKIIAAQVGSETQCIGDPVDASNQPLFRRGAEPEGLH